MGAAAEDSPGGGRGGRPGGVRTRSEHGVEAIGKGQKLEEAERHQAEQREEWHGRQPQALPGRGPGECERAGREGDERGLEGKPSAEGLICIDK